MPKRYLALAHSSPSAPGAHAEFDAPEPARLWLAALGRPGYILEERGRDAWTEYAALDSAGNIIRRGPIKIEEAVA